MLRILAGSVSAVLLLVVLWKLTEGGRVCSGGTVNVVAHQDDDLLFLSPDLLRDVRAGGCVTTIFLTAGDAGRKADYWSAREAGEMAAYATMYQSANRWRNDPLVVGDRVVASSTLVARPRVRLVFLRLPDGAVDGRGFGRGALQQLWSGAASSLTSVDSANSYSRDELLLTLRALLQDASPRTVRTMDFRPAPYGFGSGDHSDHVATAYLTEAALGAGHPALKGYLGYHGVGAGPENVEAALLRAKTEAFMAYAKHDPAIPCRSSRQCSSPRTGRSYAEWLSRQYPIP